MTMMGPGDDLTTLSDKQDHLGVLRYIRAHELREPTTVITHGLALFGEQMDAEGSCDGASKAAALEQICLAAIDVNDHHLAERCLDQLKDSPAFSADKPSQGSLVMDSDRYRRLLGRCLEAAKDYEAAMNLYETMLKKNPSNLVALQRKYCVLRAQEDSSQEAILEALNEYLGQQLSDVSGWYEMAQLRLSLADFTGASYALEQVVLGSPLDASVHVELAEVYATMGGLENTACARKHMAQALELEPTNLRAQFGLVSVSQQFLDESDASSTKQKKLDEHERLVAKELVKYGASEALKAYKGSKLFASVKRVMDDFTENLE
eukprot:CAMPEP_0116104200 /NCGR_PEP_ID=MMETSP0327-20121206/14317_1 /TAXON_ID=44447 /ORGANISM="Pseudo-nitzschia delicatissima, Strain B596" /LENGTH=320 /DNA_ID=CAMNT_0003596413 /DNA_START=157 /DNA_END=1119 /DNA_ORIENTATION=+